MDLSAFAGPAPEAPDKDSLRDETIRKAWDLKTGGSTISLYIGDCRNVMPTLPDASFRVCVTDPPYLIKNWKGFGAYKNRSYGSPPLQFEEWIPEVRRLLKDDGSIYVFEHPKNLPALLEELGKHFTYRGTIIWSVIDRHMSYKLPWYMNHYDVCVWATCGEDYVFNYDRAPDIKGNMTDVWRSLSVRDDVPVFGKKPLPLIRRCIRVSSEPGDRVLEPFVGSGTTLRAARETGRDAVGVELNIEFENIIKTKIMTETPDLGRWTDAETE